jgi:membrane protein DedA with SNARE-associated domain
MTDETVTGPPGLHRSPRPDGVPVQDAGPVSGADAGSTPRAERPPLDIAAAMRQATWVDAVCLGGIVLSIVSSYATLPLAPLLLRHVVPHLLITGSITALLTGGAAVYAGHLSFVVAVLAGVVGNAMFDGFYFWAGRRYGDHVAHFLETHGGIKPRTVARFERWTARFGLPLLAVMPFLPLPTALMILLLGASGVRWRWFVLFDFIGWSLWCATFVAVGHHFHAQVTHIAHVVEHYSTISTVTLIAIVVVVAGIRGARQQRRGPAAS